MLILMILKENNLDHRPKKARKQPPPANYGISF